MDRQELRNQVDKIRKKLSLIKSPGDIVVYSVVIDAELTKMGEAGKQVAHAVHPYFEEAMKKFASNPNTSMFHSTIEGSA